MSFSLGNIVKTIQIFLSECQIFLKKNNWITISKEEGLLDSDFFGILKHELKNSN
jgi:hypothetical protein